MEKIDRALPVALVDLNPASIKSRASGIGLGVFRGLVAKNGSGNSQG
ncbi:MAG: hypothetical protein HOC91_14280 [Nitrospinaceae bacterium]|nr:hypothetical protein [Nitrospinaceae bacterium]MBT3433810.1 hypothetical protein [Nitrospinaceae bacterium]MBT4094106.1 hypothetical protein [Nitrospinaceae bacterium]MBT4431672.1 hypothetical protein [Nitrospinaceae bacterium]MBT5369084.1 hypothetical protein [Nitrospinaceae bacterium]